MRSVGVKLSRSGLKMFGGTYCLRQKVLFVEEIASHRVNEQDGSGPNWGVKSLSEKRSELFESVADESSLTVI
jgi:hypothetical protein